MPLIAPPRAPERPAGVVPAPRRPVGPGRRLQLLAAALAVIAVAATVVLIAAGLAASRPVPGTAAGVASAAAPGPPPQPVPVPDVVARVAADTRDVAAPRADTERADTERADTERADTERADTERADTARPAAATRAARPPHAPPGGRGVAARALAIAQAKIGAPYVWGAAGPAAFDCSGLVMWAYQQVGVTLPRVAADQSRVGVRVPRDQLRPGDLVFFYTPVSHVGIYVGKGMFLNAPQPGETVQVGSMAYLPFAGGRRVTG